MKEPCWVSDKVVYAIHTMQLAEHGGKEGIRDESLLQSALDAPKNSFYYEKANLFKLAAMYGYRIGNNQPFSDGNKRTGYVVARLFLLLNGYDISASEIEKVQIFLEISSNIKSENQLAEWFEHWSIKVVD
jgi:death-on-curing protein